MEIKLVRTADGKEAWDAAAAPSENEIKYIAFGGTKEAAASAALADAPETKGFLVKSGVRFDSYGDGGEIELTVTYKEPDDDSSSGGSEDDEPTVSFDCSGGSKHLLFSVGAQTQVYIGPEEGEIDAGGAIGWNGKPGSESEITGIDVPTGQIRESYGKWFKVSSIKAKRRTWALLVGKTNAASFKGWKEGEAMFLGCSYSGNSNAGATVLVTFNFQIQENEDDAVVNGISCGAKKGFEVLSAIVKTGAETPKGSDKPSPKVALRAIHKSTVCKSGDFGQLGIGV